jgi:hypothetical protein
MKMFDGAKTNKELGDVALINGDLVKAGNHYQTAIGLSLDLSLDFAPNFDFLGSIFFRSALIAFAIGLDREAVAYNSVALGIHQNKSLLFSIQSTLYATSIDSSVRNVPFAILCARISQCLPFADPRHAEFSRVTLALALSNAGLHDDAEKTLCTVTSDKTCLIPGYATIAKAIELRVSICTDSLVMAQWVTSVLELE